MSLAILYSDGPEDTMEKTISSHRLFLAQCSRHQVTADYLMNISHNFNEYKKFEYAIEVLEGCMDMMETWKEEGQAEIYFIAAYVGCGEFLKAKTANEKRGRSNHWGPRLQSGRIDEGMCNYKSAIAHFRKAADGLQSKDTMITMIA